MKTFYVGFSSDFGSSNAKKVQASSPLEAVEKNVPTTLSLGGKTFDWKRATVLGSNPMTEHWLFVRQGGVWKEHK